MPAGQLIWLRAETFIHVGVGQQASVIDLPFAREGATGYPYIPGSAIKGALRDAYWLGVEPGGRTEEDKKKATKDLFGESADEAVGAGKILFSDARLAFLPVRTLGGTYRYVTSAGLLRRLERDCDFAGQERPKWPPCPEGNEKDMFVGPGDQTRPVFLEEFPFHQKSNHRFDGLPRLDDATLKEVNRRLVILHDDAFDYFARHGLFVRQRNKLRAETKTVEGGGLWSEESLPPDTLMYVVLTPRLPSETEVLNDDLIKILRGECGGYFQVGGNETVGEGWFKMLPPPATASPGATKTQEGE